MRSFRKALALSLTLILSMIGMGCTEGKSKDETKTNELVFYSIDPGPIISKTLQKAKSKFEADHPGTTVKFQFTTLNEYFTKLDSLVDSGHSPDVIIVGPAEFQPFEKKGYLKDMYPLAKATGTSMNAYFNNAILDLGTVNSKLVAIMLNVSPMVVAYNKSWFEQASLPFPKDNWTWEEFVDTAKTLKAKVAQNDSTRHAAIFPAGERFLSPMVMSKGGSYVSPDGSTLKDYLDSNETVEALQWYRDHVKDGVFTTTPNLAQIVPDMINNNVGMAVLNYDSTLFINAESKPKIGLVGLPRFKEGKRVTTAITNAVGIMEQSKNPQLAWEFVRMFAMDDNEITRDMLALTLNISKPVLAGAQDDPYLKVKDNELQYVKKDFMDLNMYWANVQENFQRGMERIVLGTGDMRQGLSELAASVSQQLAEAEKDREQKK